MKNTDFRNGSDRRSTYFDPLQEFDRFFDGFFTPVARQTNAFVPPYELQESERGYLLSFDLPGVPSENVQVEVKENQLKIAGERRRPEAEEGTRAVTERRYGKFERVFTLPADVDADKIEAHHDLGVLHLMLPKTEKVKAKTIKIGTGETAGGFFSRLVGGKKDESSVQ